MGGRKMGRGRVLLYTLRGIDATGPAIVNKNRDVRI